MPERVQLRRTKGWRKPEGAIVVSRPGLYGNPFRVGTVVDVYRYSDDGWVRVEVEDRAVARDLYREWLTTPPEIVRAGGWFSREHHHIRTLLDLGELRGRDLACWCPAGEPCHADVLLEIANREG